MAIAGDSSRPMTNRAVAFMASATMIALILTALFGPSFSLDPWVIGAFGLIPFGLHGWVVGRPRSLSFAAWAGAIIAANLVGGQLAGLPAQSVFSDAAGTTFLVATGMLAAMARRATDGQRQAVLAMAEHATERDALLEMQSVVAETASALLQKEPQQAIDAAISAIQRSLRAESVYVAMCGDEGDRHPSAMEWFDGATYRRQPDVSRPWADDPTLQDRVAAGERMSYQNPDANTTELVFPIVSASSRVTGLVGIVTASDRILSATEESTLTTVAELVGAAWDRQRNADRLKELLRSKDRFIASVSHELRTPLAVIVGLSCELRDDIDRFSPADRDSLIGLIAQQSEELGDMIEDLLVSARAEEHQLTVLLADVDLSELVPRILGSLPVDVGPKVTCCDTRPPIVRADPMRLRQIIRNLIVNAHRHGGPSIRLTVGVDGERGLIRVTDDGGGIPAEFHETIFTPYGRASFDPGRTYSMGLGLTVSRQLARLMDGDIRYRHDQGGSTFEVSLPLSDAQPENVGLPMSAVCTPRVQDGPVSRAG